MNIIFGLANSLLSFYGFLLFVYVIMFYLIMFRVVDPYNQIVSKLNNFLIKIFEPILEQIRKIIPTYSGIDFSIIILFLMIYFLQNILVNLYFGSANLNPIVNLIAAIFSVFNFFLLIYMILYHLSIYKIVNLSNNLIYRILLFFDKIFEPILKPIRKIIHTWRKFDFAILSLYITIEIAGYGIYQYLLV